MMIAFIHVYGLLISVHIYIGLQFGDGYDRRVVVLFLSILSLLLFRNMKFAAPKFLPGVNPRDSYVVFAYEP